MKSQVCEYSHLYKPARKWEVINDGDNDLTPIYFSLPEPPPLHLIDGWGLHPDEQYFRRLEVPKKLIKLEDKSLSLLYEIEKVNRQETIQGYKLYLKYWDLIEQEAEYLGSEIEWLKKIWWHRIHGYWVFIDGEPTFISNEYFDFLNFYYISESKTYPEYRDDIRRKSCFVRYLMNCTETFADLDPQTGMALKIEDKYRMTNLGRRVFLGDIEPKTRRVGATHEGIHSILFGAVTHESFFSTIISLGGENAKALYEQKLLPAWDNYPMCLKPIWEGNRRPTVLKLSAPPNVYHVKGLNSAISFTESAGEKKSEGKRINRILSDETGKTMSSDVAERHHVNKLCMSTGMGVNIIEGAYMKNPSTVEEMDAGGEAYYKICLLSNFYRRIPSLGQTHEGLARIFLPAYLRLEGYIDKFGKSVIDIPTERQCRLNPNSVFATSGKGARQMLQEQRDSLLAQGTQEALEAYRSMRRKSPFNWSECWLGSSGNVGFNLEIIDSRLSEINRMRSLGKTPYKIGNFYRKGDAVDGDVHWDTNPDNGKFRMSMDVPRQFCNKKTMENIFDASKGMFVPMWRPVGGDAFTCGADPFRYMNKMEARATLSNSRQSDGGICIIYDVNNVIDVVLTYRQRPASQREYMEDVLMACQYYSCMCYPENNVEDLYKHFIDRGYGGYLLYSVDIRTGRLRDKPGEFTSNENKVSYFTAVKDYIQFFGNKCNHDDLLDEIKNIKGTDDLNSKDLLASLCLSLRGNQSRFRQIIEATMSNSFNLSGVGMFKKRRI